MVIIVIVIMKVMGRARVTMIVIMIMSNKNGRVTVKVVVISTIISIYIKDDNLRIIIAVIDFSAPKVPHALVQ